MFDCGKKDHFASHFLPEEKNARTHCKLLIFNSFKASTLFTYGTIYWNTTYFMGRRKEHETDGRFRLH